MDGQAVKGFCTDAVIYDFETGQVLCEAKTLTTHHDLKIGITEVLRRLPENLLRECRQAALSTTLATNACVENLGGKGKIIFLGVSRKVFMETWCSYGFRSLDDILLVDCRILPDPAASEEPDWEALREKLPDFLKDCDCVSIVQLYAADRGGKIHLGKTRVQPLCTLASEYPQVLEALEKLDASGRLNVCPLHEFFILLKDIEDDESGHFYQSEKALCRALKEGPLSYEAACAAMEKDIYTADFSRLESARVILRCGLTPTDFMHLRGDFNAFSTQASLHAAAFFVRSSEAEDVDALARKAYDLVAERLYKNLVRILLTTECTSLSKNPFDVQMDALIDYAWKLASAGSRRNKGFLPNIFETRAKLVGVGAPTHIFLPRVAKMLHTQAILPEHAAVANAVGAITGQVTAVTEVSLSPVTGDDYGNVLVVSRDHRRTFSSRAKALSFARKEGRRIAADQAQKQGARGPLEIREELVRSDTPMGYGSIWLGDTLRFTASGTTLR